MSQEFTTFQPVDADRAIQMTVSFDTRPSHRTVTFDLIELGDLMETETMTFTEIADRLTNRLNERG